MNMKLILLLAVIGLFPSSVLAATVTGTLVAGGGIDDHSIDIKTAKGQIVTAYCHSVCGPWFTEPDQNEAVYLKKALRGKKVVLEYVTESNRNRIAGPGDDEPLNFIKKIQFMQ